MTKPIHAKFEMNVWQRIKAACSLWWAVVVTKEVTCFDDERLETVLKPILEGFVEMPPYDDGKSPESIGFFGDLHLDKPENAYHFGFQTALFECGEIIAKILEEKENA